MTNFSLFSGTSHNHFSNEVASLLNISLGKADFSPFPDGELFVQLLENVRGREVFVIQTIARQPNDFLFELLMTADALKRASAKSICAILPYFGYSRQDRKEAPRVPITAKLIADLLQTSGISRVVTMDLHAGQIQGFFDIPVDNLFARPLLVKAIEKDAKPIDVVIAPDLGAIKKAHLYAQALKADFGVVDKKRLNTKTVEAIALVGSVDGKNVLIVDDMCSTGATLCEAASVCLNRGAKTVIAAFTHPLLVDQAVEKLSKSAFKKIYFANTIPTSHLELGPKFQEVTVAPLFAEAVKCILSDQSISSLF